MFDSLSQKLQGIFEKLKRKAKLSEKDVDAVLKEIRVALLEADVNYKVVKTFISRVKEKALGKEVLESFTPAQQIVKIVRDELIYLLGETSKGISIKEPYPFLMLMVGLQGSGKTTTTGKLANFLKKEKGRRPLLVGLDVKRPAASRQLAIISEKVGVPYVIDESGKTSPLKLLEMAIKKAEKEGFDVVIGDTAGRLQVDEEMMTELEEMEKRFNPREILLVIDAMIGQEAVNVAKIFNERLNITGFILTKMDGDARGGAALSIREITGKPIKLIGVGEKIEDLEFFYPDRIASRILGMGDMLTLIEKIEKTQDKKKQEETAKKFAKNQFNFEDFLDQLHQIKKMGPLDNLLSMVPGLSPGGKLPQVDEKELVKIEAIINSMTREERRHPEIINASRRKRIARGSGTEISDVNRLIGQFKKMKKMMKKLKRMKNIKTGISNFLPF